MHRGCRQILVMSLARRADASSSKMARWQRRAFAVDAEASLHAMSSMAWMSGMVSFRGAVG